MKTLKSIFAALVIVSFASVSVSAQNPSATAESSATIIQPIQIVKSANLNFGNIVALASQVKVTVTPQDGRSADNVLALPTATPGTITAAKFNITGLADATYSIQVVNTSFTVTGAGDPMTVDAIVTSPTPTGTLDGNGTETVNVGATLTVNPGQTAGVYSNQNSLEIRVAYN